MRTKRHWVFFIFILVSFFRVNLAGAVTCHNLLLGSLDPIAIGFLEELRNRDLVTLRFFQKTVPNESPRTVIYLDFGGASTPEVLFAKRQFKALEPAFAVRGLLGAEVLAASKPEALSLKELVTPFTGGLWLSFGGSGLENDEDDDDQDEDVEHGERQISDIQKALVLQAAAEGMLDRLIHSTVVERKQVSIGYQAKRKNRKGSKERTMSGQTLVHLYASLERSGEIPADAPFLFSKLSDSRSEPEVKPEVSLSDAVSSRAVRYSLKLRKFLMSVAGVSVSGDIYNFVGSFFGVPSGTHETDSTPWLDSARKIRNWVLGITAGWTVLDSLAGRSLSIPGFMGPLLPRSYQAQRLDRETRARIHSFVETKDARVFLVTGGGDDYLAPVLLTEGYSEVSIEEPGVN